MNADKAKTVSVIIPVYNVASYLAKCLDSLLSQTLKGVEIICVDDGSTDESPHILDDYARKDSRIQVIHQKNAGAGAARNCGLDMAVGEYVFFLDPDDFCRRGMLRALYRRATKTEADIVVSGRVIYDGEGDHIVGYRGLDADLWLRRQPFSAQDISRKIFAFSKNVAWDKLFRREFILRQGIRFQCIPRSNDVYFVNIALATAGRIALAFGAWICHRRGRDGSLQSTKDKSPECIYLAFDALKDRLEELGLFDRFEASYLDGLLSSGIYNLRTLAQPANVLWSYKELKSRVSAIVRARPLEEVVPSGPVRKRLKRLLESLAPADLVLEKSSTAGKVLLLPFRLRESLKIAGYLLRRARRKLTRRNTR